MSTILISSLSLLSRAPAEHPSSIHRFLSLSVKYLQQYNSNEHNLRLLDVFTNPTFLKQLLAEKGREVTPHIIRLGEEEAMEQKAVDGAGLSISNERDVNIPDYLLMIMEECMLIIVECDQLGLCLTAWRVVMNLLTFLSSSRVAHFRGALLHICEAYIKSGGGLFEIVKQVSCESISIDENSGKAVSKALSKQAAEDIERVSREISRCCLTVYSQTMRCHVNESVGARNIEKQSTGQCLIYSRLTDSFSIYLLI